MALETGTCAWCKGDLPPRRRTGRPRRYCSNACRHATRRPKTGYIDWATSADVRLPDLTDVPAPDVNEQAVLTLHELRTLASVCLRLGIEARPHLAWRFGRLGDGNITLMNDLFGVGS